MSDTTAKTLTAATEAMISAGSDWLSPADAPALALLRTLAKQIDADPTAALSSAFGTAYRALLKRAPKAEAPKSPLGAALAEAAAT